MDIFPDAFDNLRRICAAHPECQDCPIKIFCLDERYIPLIAKYLAWDEVMRIIDAWLDAHPKEKGRQITHSEQSRANRCAKLLEKFVVSPYEMADLEEISSDTTCDAYQVLTF